MKIIQVIVTIQKGDAIGNFTLSLDKLFKINGFDSRICAENVGKGISKKYIDDFSLLDKVKKDDLIIYQMCEGNQINKKIKKLLCKKIAIYHNVTPPEFFRRYGRSMISIQENAIKEIREMNQTFDKCIADSEFNKQDLIKMGYDENKIEVIPIIVQYDDFKKKPDEEIIKQYKADDYVNFLFVGRIVPNKKQEDIIRTFAYYKKHINDKARLILIGSPFSDDYYNDLITYIHVLELENSIVIPGHISFEKILAFYSVADVFLCMSEHEGFCVPLVEAMLFDIPIVAYDSTAIKYTLGRGGVLIQDKNPVIFADTINKILLNTSMKEEIITQQRIRLDELKQSSIENKIMKAIRIAIEGRI